MANPNGIPIKITKVSVSTSSLLSTLVTLQTTTRQVTLIAAGIIYVSTSSGSTACTSADMPLQATTGYVFTRASAVELSAIKVFAGSATALWIIEEA